MESLEAMDSILGTPSSQQILRFLSIRDFLSIKDFEKLTSLSHSQIQYTLQNLIKLGLVSRKSRGIYQLNESPLANNFKKTYLKSTTLYLNEQINLIFGLIDKGENDDAFVVFESIMKKYQAILEEYFADIMENLSHQMLEIV
ncbi:MAG: MarR family transcriptional regulator [Candidatus Heimdallarchaeota archaeon]